MNIHHASGIFHCRNHAAQALRIPATSCWPRNPCTSNLRPIGVSYWRFRIIQPTGNEAPTIPKRAAFLILAASAWGPTTSMQRIPPAIAASPAYRVTPARAVRAAARMRFDLPPLSKYRLRSKSDGRKKKRYDPSERATVWYAMRSPAPRVNAEQRSAAARDFPEKLYVTTPAQNTFTPHIPA